MTGVPTAVTSVPRVARATPQRILIALMYHEVTDDPAKTGFQRASARIYKHRVHEFQMNLDQITCNGVRPERIDRLGEGERHLLLTFDDGGRSALTAADILESRGSTGHFFVVTGLLDTPHFLSKAGVRDLHARGHLVGSHSHTHPDVFRRLTPAQMDDEWRRSRAILEDVIGAPVVAASIPGGHGDLATERTAAGGRLRLPVHLPAAAGPVADGQDSLRRTRLSEGRHRAGTGRRAGARPGIHPRTHAVAGEVRGARSWLICRTVDPRLLRASPPLAPAVCRLTPHGSCRVACSSPATSVSRSRRPPARAASSSRLSVPQPAATSAAGPPAGS